MNWLKQLFCKHREILWCISYGGEYVHHCTKCGRLRIRRH